MSRSPDTELNVSIPIGGSDVLLDQVPLDHADCPIGLEVAISKNAADPRQNAGETEPPVLRMEPCAAAEADGAGNAMGRRAANVKVRVVGDARVQDALHFLGKRTRRPMEQPPCLRHDCFTLIVHAADPVGIRFVDLVAGRIEDRKQRIPVAERNLPAVEGDQFVDICPHPQLNAPVAGNAVDQQQKTRNFFDRAPAHGHGIRQSQISVMCHPALHFVC